MPDLILLEGIHANNQPVLVFLYLCMFSIRKDIICHLFMSVIVNLRQLLLFRVVLCFMVVCPYDQ